MITVKKPTKKAMKELGKTNLLDKLKQRIPKIKNGD